MLRSLSSKYRKTRDRFRDQTYDEWATTKGRKQSWWHDMLFDHAYLRKYWTNFGVVAPDVYRANHGPDARFAQYFHKHGIKTVLNLRGQTTAGHYHAENELCKAHGVQLIDIKLNAHKAPKRARLLELVDAVEAAQTPVLIHCKSGADRAGLTAAIYRIVVLNHSAKDAKKELTWRFWHVRKSTAGILDYILDSYDAAQQQTGITLVDWVETVYNSHVMKAEFSALKWWNR